MSECVSQLDEAMREKARRELREDPLTRLEALAEMTQWLASKPHIRCPTDAPILLRYLRASKFDLIKAQSRLTNHMSLYARLPSWFTQVDTHDPRVLAVLDSRMVMYLPGADYQNQKVILYRMGSFCTDSEEYDKAAIMRAFTALFMHEISREENQVNGFVYFLDVSNFSLKQQLFWTPADIVVIAKLWQNALPCRFKAFHFYNIGPVFEVLLKMLKPFLSQKFRDRIKIHQSMSTVYEYIPHEILPDEYQPEGHIGSSAGPMQNILNEMKSDLMQPEVRESILNMTGPDYGINDGLKPQSVSRWHQMLNWLQGADTQRKKELYNQMKTDKQSS